MARLARFNEWFVGRKFDMRIPAVIDGKIMHTEVQRTFAKWRNLHFSEDTNGNTKDIKKIINMYLVEPTHDHLSIS